MQACSTKDIAVRFEVKSQEEAASSFNRAVYGTVKRGSPGYKALEVPRVSSRGFTGQFSVLENAASKEELQ